MKTPKVFQSSSKEAQTKRSSNSAITSSIESWKPLLESLNKFTDDFLETRNQPKQQTRKDLFL